MLAENPNVLDGAAPFYSVYETADGEYMAVGALEPKFFAELVQRLELTAEQQERFGIQVETHVHLHAADGRMF